MGIILPNQKLCNVSKIDSIQVATKEILFKSYQNIRSLSK